MKPYPCEACGKLCGPYERIERRIEMRDARTQARYLVVTTGHICRKCADEEVEQYRPTAKNQGSLL